jgi:hypothetical protein
MIRISLAVDTTARCALQPAVVNLCPMAESVSCCAFSSLRSKLLRKYYEVMTALPKSRPTAFPMVLL